MTFDKLLEELNKRNIIQKNCEWNEGDIPEDLEDEFMDATQVDSRLAIDKHRHYETSITILEIKGRFLGIRLVTDTFNDMISYSDCEHQIEFKEYEQIKMTSYQPKKV